MSIMRDNTGKIILPGRVTREWVDAVTPGATAPATFLTAAAGTYSTPSGWSGSSDGRAKILTGAVSGNAGAIKGAAPFNVIAPGNFNALVLTLESLAASDDTGADFEFGFQGNGSVGGASFIHLNGATTGVIRTRSSSGTITDFPTNVPLFGDFGAGRSRRTLSFMLFPRGYVGDNRPFAYLVQEDQVLAEADLSGAFDSTLAVCPIFQIVTRTSAARSMSWAQVRLQINQN